MEAAKGLDSNVVKRIQQSRRELLDLSARNRLINTPRESSHGRKIEVVDERSEEVFRLLLSGERIMSSFLPRRRGRGASARVPNVHLGV